jgi:F-type H+-transporting ATPase subunit b
MKKRLTRPLCSLLIAASFLGGELVLAAETHGGSEGPSLTNTLFLPLFNFTVFVVLLYWFAWPAVLSALAERRRSIENELSEADRAQREATTMHAEIVARRAQLAAEAERLERSLREEAEADRRRLLEAARRSAERIREDARLLAEQEGARAGREIRQQVAAQVIARVTGALRERVTREDEERFVRAFLSAVDTGEIQ